MKKFNDLSDASKVALLSMVVGKLLNADVEENGQESGDKLAKDVFSALYITPTSFAELSQKTSPEVEKELSELTGMPVSDFHFMRYVPYNEEAHEEFASDYIKLPLDVLRSRMVEAGVIDMDRARWKYHHQLVEILRRYNLGKPFAEQLDLSKSAK